MKSLSTLLAIFALSGLQTSQAADEADFSSAILSTSSIRTVYTEMVQSQGVPPSTLGELGLDESYFRSPLINHIDIEPVSGAIMIGLSPEFGQNEWISLIPSSNNIGLIEWACQTTVPAQLAGDTGCRANLPYEHLTQALDTRLFLKTLVSTNHIKVNAAESYMTTGRFPTSMAELGIDQQWLDSANIDHVIVEPNSNTILLGLSDIYGTNEWLAIKPRIRFNGYISYWKYKTTLPRSIANVNGVRPEVEIENLIR